MKNNLINAITLLLTMVLTDVFIPEVAPEKAFWAAMAFLGLSRITDILSHMESKK